MFQKISVSKEENMEIEETDDVTTRRSFLIGRVMRKLRGQMFTQIFYPMTWHKSSGSCKRGSATCTICMFEDYAIRIVHTYKGSSNDIEDWSKISKDTLLSYYGADNNYSPFSLYLLQNTRPLMIVIVYIY